MRDIDEKVKKEDGVTIKNRGFLLRWKRRKKGCKGGMHTLERKSKLLSVLEGETDKLVLSPALSWTSCICSRRTRAHSLKCLPEHCALDH